MSDTYTKLFRSLAASTIASEPLATRWLWVVMLSQADKRGNVYGSVPGLARLANITIQETEAALLSFQSPDPYSRTEDNGGRRVERVTGGWHLLNHAKYDAIRNEDERREYKARKQREYRERDRQGGQSTESRVDKVDGAWTGVDKVDTTNTNTSTNTSTNTNTNTITPDTPPQSDSSLVLDTHRASACEEPDGAVSVIEVVLAALDEPPRSSDAPQRTQDAPLSPGEACKAMREAGMASTAPAHPEVQALVAAGATREQFTHAAAVAVSKGKGFAYALGVLKGQLADATAPPKAGRGNPEAIHTQNRSVAAAWLADCTEGEAA